MTSCWQRATSPGQDGTAHLPVYAINYKIHPAAYYDTPFVFAGGNNVKEGFCEEEVCELEDTINHYQPPSSHKGLKGRIQKRESRTVSVMGVL